MARRDQPYLPLYVQDFLTDEKLNECSASATGVYIRLLCIMHKSDPYGTISLKTKNKRTADPIENFAEKLSRQMPYAAEEIRSALVELIDEGVIQIDGDTISQKRMVKDGRISELRAHAGRKGGEQTGARRRSRDAADFAEANSAASSENEDETEIENEKPTLISVYMDKIGGIPSSTVQSELEEFQKALPDNVILHAVDIALDANHRSWRYIREILRRYIAEGRTTLGAVLSAEEDFQRRKDEKRGTSNGNRSQRSADADVRWGIHSANIG